MIAYSEDIFIDLFYTKCIPNVLNSVNFTLYILQFQWKVGYLKDNLMMDKYFYLISVYTGLRKNSGTRSNISFVLAGDSGDTGVRQLTDGKRVYSFNLMIPITLN